MTLESTGLPLSAGQHGIWLGQQLELNSPLYNAAEAIEIPGRVDATLLAAAVQQATREVDALQMCFRETAGAVLQWPRERADEAASPRIDLSAVQEPWQRAEQLMRADLQTRFDLGSGPLFRSQIFKLSAERTLWYFAAHHIALDGFSFSLIAQRVAELYNAACAGGAARDAWFGALAQVVEEDESYRSSADLLSDRAFWLARFADAAPARSLSGKAAFPSHSSVHSAALLPHDLKQRLDQLARAHGGSWADALLAAFAGYFQRACPGRDVVLGLPVMGRLGSRAVRVPCMRMNIVPLRVSVHEADDFGSLLARVIGELRTLRPHTRYRYEWLRRDLRLLGARRRLFGPVINIMPFDYGLHFLGQRARVHRIAAGPVEDLSVALAPANAGQGLTIDFDANPACYDAQQVHLHQVGFMELVQRWSERPSDALGGRASSASRERNDEALLYGEPLVRPACDVLARFLAHATSAPERTALVQGNETRSYAQLCQRVRVLAAQLAAHGVTAGSLVALALPRSFDAIEGMLAVLFLGAAYLPLDPDGPSERMATILADARPWLVLGSDAYRARSTEIACRRFVSIETLRAGEPLLEPHALADDALAYVIYTSGTGGRPNGVMVPRAALSHFVAAAEQRYELSRDDRILQFAPLYFDASVEEIFVSLALGATLVLRDEAMLQSMALFLRACERQAVSVLDLPTAFFHELSFALATQPLELPASLRCVIIGGEAALPERVAQFHRATQHELRLLNTYGPTECTVVALCARLAKGDEPSPLPIGTPLPGLSALVLSESGAATGVGEVGELFLLGPSLARGYAHRPELNQQRFVTLVQLPGSPRAYRTGDLVRQLPTGALTFVGRADDQLKISGQRIELREIESVLTAHPAVHEVAVLAHSGANGATQLVAYVAAAAELSTAALRTHAQNGLLSAAVPARFVLLSRLPKSASGKIDRKALGALELEPASQLSEVSDDPLEQTIRAIWCEVLAVKGLAREDDFFERGAQSLQTIQVANRLSAALGREISVALLFDHPSVASLAAALGGNAEGESEQPSARALLREDVTLLDTLHVPADLEPPQSDPRCLLLTGATGFVGAFLLRELLDRSDACVICLVRAESDVLASGRVRAALERHGLSLRGFAERVVSLPADLARPRLGLGERGFQRIASECDAIYHAAANVSLVRSYLSLRASNVLAIAQLVQLATCSRRKPIHYLSTLAVPYGAFEDGQLCEEPVPLHRGLRDGYTESKWAAERLLERARERGVPVSIYRLGRVVGPRDTGFVNAEDIVWRILRSAIEVGALPELSVSEPWTPVDFVVRAVVHAALSCAPALCHVAPERLLALPQLFAWLRAYGYPLVDCSVPRFCELLRRSERLADQATLAFFEAQNAQATANAPLASVRSDVLRSALAGSGITCPDVDRALAHHYFDFCVRNGLFPAPPKSKPRHRPPTGETMSIKTSAASAFAASGLPRVRASLCLTRSEQLLAEATRLIPGITQSLMKRPEMFALGSFPVYLEGGQGALVRDVDGNEYIDFICGLGANTLGQNHPAVLQALRTHLESGVLHSLPTEIEVSATRALLPLIPGAEMARFFKTGADATSAAVRLARHVTGKPKIITVGYNGWHDHFMFDTPGVPAALKELTLRMPLMAEQHEEPLLQRISAQGDEIAALLLSLPYNRVLSAEFLHRLRAHCQAHGVLFVLDEVVTGFRIALGGAQQHYDLQADFVCLSKGIAAGMPLSAVAGPKRLLERMADLQVSTTFGGELLSLQVCKAALGVYRDTDYVQHMAALGRRLRDGVNESAARRGSTLRVLGYDAIPFFRYAEDLAVHTRFMERFLGAMARRGVILRRDVNFISAAHSEAQIDFTVQAADEALQELGSRES